MEGRRDIDVGSVFVGSNLELNWRSYSNCGGGCQLIREDLHGTERNFKQVKFRNFWDFLEVWEATVPPVVNESLPC